MTEFKMTEFNIGEFKMTEFNIGEFKMTEFNIGEFKMTEFNIGEFNMAEFNIGEFKMTEFNIGEFNMAELDPQVVFLNKEEFKKKGSLPRFQRIRSKFRRFLNKGEFQTEDNLTRLQKIGAGFRRFQQKTVEKCTFLRDPRFGAAAGGVLTVIVLSRSVARAVPLPLVADPGKIDTDLEKRRRLEKRQNPEAFKIRFLAMVRESYKKSPGIYIAACVGTLVIIILGCMHVFHLYPSSFWQVEKAQKGQKIIRDIYDVQKGKQAVRDISDAQRELERIGRVIDDLIVLASNEPE